MVISAGAFANNTAGGTVTDSTGLNAYSPQFWANEALIWLKKRKGMAQRVYRRYEGERNTFGYGDVVNFRRPTKFEAQDAPNSSFQDLNTGTEQCKLDIFKEVPFTVSDVELAFGGERLIQEHIGPAADALGEYMDNHLASLFVGCPHTVDLDGATVKADMPGTLASIRQVMMENHIPSDGKPLHYVASPSTIARALGTPAFSQQQGAGDQGVNAQNTGNIGPKYGFNWFETTNLTQVAGDDLLAADVIAAGGATVATALLKNATQVTLPLGAATGKTLRKGQVISITGDDSGTGTTYTEKYAVTEDSADTGTGYANVQISPRLRRPLDTAATWQVVSTTPVGTAASGSALSYTAEPIFHPNAAALIMVPLPVHSPDLGARMAVATDEETGISIRARMAYESRNAKVHVIYDMLGGAKLLNPDLAVRGCVYA